MKKIVLSLFFALAFIISGCGINNNNDIAALQEKNETLQKQINVLQSTENDVTEPATKDETTTDVPTTEIATEPTSVVDDSPGDFRNADWGMSKEEVIVSEESSSAGNSALISYYDLKVANMNCSLVYNFNESNQLYATAYFFDEVHSDDNDYIKDYETLKKAMEEKYGEPTYGGIIWSDNRYKNKPENYGLSLANGYHSYYYYWELENTTICICLKGDNSKIEMSALYTAKNIEPPVQPDSGV